MPVPWIQAIDGLAAVVLVPPLMLWWQAQAKRGRESDEFVKIASGCFIFGIALCWLGAGTLIYSDSARIPLLWALVCHLLSNLGYLFVHPIATALYSRATPAGINATVVSHYSVSIFLGSTVSGRLGGFYHSESSTQFWFLHAVIVGCAGIVMLALARRQRLKLQPS